MNIRNFLSNTFYDLSVLALKRDSLLKMSKVRLEYFRLLTKLNLFNKILKLKIEKEKIFGHPINFFSYENLFILFGEIFLEEQYYFITEKKDPLIIDCGSNIGMSIIYFKHIYPQAKIIGFEPDPVTNNLLRQNIKENLFDNVKIHQQAVCDAEGEVDFFVDRDETSALWMSVVKEVSQRKGELANSVKVPSTRLSNYITEPVDLLKVDVEGAEYDVMNDLHSRNKLQLINQMVIEGHVHDENWIPHVTKLLNILKDNGFKCILTNPFGLYTASDYDHWRFMLYAKKKSA